MSDQQPSGSIIVYTMPDVSEKANDYDQMRGDYGQMRGWFGSPDRRRFNG